MSNKDRDPNPNDSGIYGEWEPIPVIDGDPGDEQPDTSYQTF